MSNVLVTGGLGFIGSNFISKIIEKKILVNVDSETYASVDKSFLISNQIKIIDIII